MDNRPCRARGEEKYTFESNMSTEGMVALREQTTYPETTSCRTTRNQIPDPDVGGVPRRRFALGSFVGLLARFELLDNPLESSNNFCVCWISFVLFCTWRRVQPEKSVGRFSSALSSVGHSLSNVVIMVSMNQVDDCRHFMSLSYWRTAAYDSNCDRSVMFGSALTLSRSSALGGDKVYSDLKGDLNFLRISESGVLRLG